MDNEELTVCVEMPEREHVRLYGEDIGVFVNEVEHEDYTYEINGILVFRPRKKKLVPSTKMTMSEFSELVPNKDQRVMYRFDYCDVRDLYVNNELVWEISYRDKESDKKHISYAGRGNVEIEIYRNSDIEKVLRRLNNIGMKVIE